MRVELERTINADSQAVWHALMDIEEFAHNIERIEQIDIVDLSDDRRTAAWGVTLRGALLQWVETATLDHEGLVVEFKQVSGDLSQFEGSWTLTPIESDAVVVRFKIDFEIGIPMLAAILNPIAEQELRDTCASILDLVEHSVHAAR